MVVVFILVIVVISIIKRLVYSSILHDSRGSTDVDPDEEKV